MPHVKNCWVDWNMPQPITSLCGRYGGVEAKDPNDITCERCLNVYQRTIDKDFVPRKFYEDTYQKLFAIANSLSGNRTGHLAAQLHDLANRVWEYGQKL